MTTAACSVTTKAGRPELVMRRKPGVERFESLGRITPTYTHIPFELRSDVIIDNLGIEYLY
jgi:hypothetical protein